MDINSIENSPPPEMHEIEQEKSEEIQEEQQTQETSEPVKEKHTIDVFA